MSNIESIIQNWPWPLKVTTFFVALFFLFVFITVLSLIFLRGYKNRREQKKKSFLEQTDSFLNNFLFDDTIDLRKEAQTFKSQHLTSTLQKKIAIRQILIYNENLKGESSVTLKNIFHQLALDQFILDALKEGRWFDKARAIYVLSELHVKESRAVARYLNDRHETVRAQAIYFFIKTAEDNPLTFFAKLKKELTLWEMIQIEDSLKFVYEGPTPDFSIWLDHQLSTVLIFSIRMIQQFNQFEHIPAIVPFLGHPNENVRKETIESLRKLNYEGLLDVIVPKFPTESRMVKKEIIKAVETLGDLRMLHQLKPALVQKEEWQTNLMYLRAEKRMQPEL
ncbi:HEAT repeat domain-containing protein [Flagellimonas crocea]|uniref:HEAT repeat domain-containing protein n=1 Tax=Flagellimonas crocea TaxID=3067311 RepID=UPI00296EC934|nr:HEAT repeat domain-containing protein [Muricauda sp. DH64]